VGHDKHDPDVTDKTLDDLLLALDQPGGRYKLTREEYERIAPDLKIVFAFLRDAGFAPHWQAHWRSEVEAKVAEFAPMTSIMDILPAVEGILGHPLEAQKNGMTLLIVACTLVSLRELFTLSTIPFSRTS